MANEGKNTMHINWMDQNVTGTTDPDDATPITLEFKDYENIYVMKLSRSNAEWLRKALKEAIWLSKLGRD